MELADEIDFRLESQLDKCRCCFRTLQTKESTEITQNIEKRFFELTQIHVNRIVFSTFIVKH